jgi:hypothetical protein
MQVLHTPKTALIIVTVAWMLTQIIAWLHFGVKTGVDTSGYVSDAMAIRNGDWSAVELPHYVSYSLLLAGVIAVTGSFSNMVVVQVILSLVSVLLLYRLTFSISRSAFSAFVGAMLFVVWPDVSQWNFFIYTDSAFTSLVVISIALLHFSKYPLQYVLVAVLIVFTIFIRPVGVVFFLSILIYLLNRFREIAPARLIAGAFIVIGLITVNFIMRGSIDSFLSSYKNAEIIYPGVNVGVQAPADISVPASGNQPVVRLILFVISNPVYFLKLFSMKVAFFVGHVKPYFSVSHNILIGIFLYPLYIMAVPGVLSLNNSQLRSFAVSFIGLQVVMVGLTSENWDGRFLLPVLPWVFILSSLGLTKVLKDRMSWALH